MDAYDQILNYDFLCQLDLAWQAEIGEHEDASPHPREDGPND